MTHRPNTMKLTYSVEKVVTSTQYWCTHCGWADAQQFSTNPRTGQLYKRCNTCRLLRGKGTK